MGDVKRYGGFEGGMGISPFAGYTLEQVADRCDDAAEVARDLLAAQARIAELERDMEAREDAAWKRGCHGRTVDKERIEELEDALRYLASYVGNGGHNAPSPIDIDQFVGKVKDGIDRVSDPLIALSETYRKRIAELERELRESAAYAEQQRSRAAVTEQQATCMARVAELEASQRADSGAECREFRCGDATAGIDERGCYQLGADGARHDADAAYVLTVAESQRRVDHARITKLERELEAALAPPDKST